MTGWDDGIFITLWYPVQLGVTDSGSEAGMTVSVYPAGPERV